MADPDQQPNLSNGLDGYRAGSRVLQLTRDLDDVEPKKQDFDGDTFEIIKPALGDDTRDGGFVLEHVGLYVEASRFLEIRCELAVVSVKRIPYGSLGKKTHREPVLHQNIIG